MALAGRGPILNVTIAIADQVAQELVKQGKAVQPAVSGVALIDTGASTTCVDDETAQQLGLSIIDVIAMSSASHASHPANVYPIRINVAGLPVGINAPRAVGAALKAQGLIALIGRDILVSCTLHYNGMAGEITLAIKKTALLSGTFLSLPCAEQKRQNPKHTNLQKTSIAILGTLLATSFALAED